MTAEDRVYQDITIHINGVINLHSFIKYTHMVIFLIFFYFQNTTLADREI